MKSLITPFLAAAMLSSATWAASVSENFTEHCAKCHGPDGRGQTKMGKKLKVRDMTTAAYKNELDDAKAFVALKEGLKKDGKEIKKSFAADLSDADLKALVGYVRSLK